MIDDGQMDWTVEFIQSRTEGTSSENGHGQLQLQACFERDVGTMNKVNVVNIADNDGTCA